MRYEFQLLRPSSGTCWICGSKANPTREHKFKASDLRRHFKDKTMMIGGSAYPARMRIAQGVKSDHLKFKSTICKRCNSSLTQEADRAYDKFIQIIESNGSNREAFQRAFNDSAFQVDGTSYLSLFRYFAKLLGCHLAEINAPIPVHLSQFVATVTDENCIRLDAQVDPMYSGLSEILPNKPLTYAAHDGLAIMTRGDALLPTKAYSSITVGPIQFSFEYNFAVLEIWEMRLRYPDFIAQCAESAIKSLSEMTV